ncbi:MAG: tetratricopeptide repeat protein, partial [Gammaproteobacteria bacterium]
MPNAQTQRVYRLMDEAAAFYNRDDVEHAYRSACAVLALSADFAPALHLRGLCEWRRGDLAAAAASIRQALHSGPRDARRLHDLAGVYADREMWALAAETLQEAIGLRPDNAGSHLNLGRVYENLGEHGAAERAYRKALELDPHSAAAAGNLAALCEESNRLDEADAMVRMALALDSNDVLSNLTRAQLLIRNGHDREAAARLEKFLARSDLSPGNRAVALARLGAAREGFGDYDRAFEAFRDSNAVFLGPAGSTADAGVYTLETVRRIRRCQTALLPSRNTAVTAERPVFLVGFPR